VFGFYPFAFSPVCTDQLQLYEALPGELPTLELLREGLDAAFGGAAPA
jgi:hypothetical protein